MATHPTKVKQKMTNFRDETSRHASAGFTLLEVVITIGILVVLAVAVTELLKSNIDIRFALGNESMVTHRVGQTMKRISKDIEHAFIIGRRDTLRRTRNRFGDTIFQMEQRGESSELKFTTMSHESLIANSHESDLTYVVYQLKVDENNSAVFHLYRGEAKFIPERFRDNPPLRLIARNIKSFMVEAWRGDRWVKDRWDTERSEWRDKLPRMVKVTLETYIEDVTNEDYVPDRELSDEPTLTTGSVFMLPYALGLEELRPSTAGTIRWDRL